MVLTPKQEAFALAYIKLGNATAAYREAYASKMSDPAINVEACRLLKHPKISLRISELAAPVLAAAGLTAERALQENARIALFDARKLYGTDGKEKLPHEWDDETAAAMSPRLESGATPHDKNRALDMAFKHLGLYERDNAQRGESLAIQVNIVK